MRKAPPVKTERWQGVPVNTDTFELQDVNVSVPLHGGEGLEHWRQDTNCNRPWADDHFLERVGGEPLNPGTQWAKWPWGLSAAKFKTERFNHTYMERLWPKFARRTDDGVLPKPPAGEYGLRKWPAVDNRPKYGIAHGYGDLQDLIDLLAREPHTRQAYIPLFFPEDTGLSDGGRKVCTLGYQIMVRDKRAMIWYPLRSCDLIRHYNDDCYLAVRLLLWVIEQCRRLNPQVWNEIVPWTYSMHMTSLHVFKNDMDTYLAQEKQNGNV
ncbi:MAG: hypothetical protein EHM78_02005 [Myxococcaceae bacterium]|nr:MAG: hypothetical protein EHM78_02005 [Myxococcaceae bacterium]